MGVENTEMANHVGHPGPKTGRGDDDVRPHIGAVREDDPIAVEVIHGRARS